MRKKLQQTDRSLFSRPSLVPLLAHGLHQPGQGYQVEHPLQIINEATELKLSSYCLKPTLQKMPETEGALDRAKGVFDQLLTLCNESRYSGEISQNNRDRPRALGRSAECAVLSRNKP